VYQKILVPLDGSALAECALPHAHSLVRNGCGKEVVILNVSCFEKTPIEYWTPLRGKSRMYLEAVESRLAVEGIKAETEYLEGDRPAEVITNYAREKGIDLIIIATHGYTGFRKMMFGSVALEILHNSPAPVLLIRPESCRT